MKLLVYIFVYLYGMSMGGTALLMLKEASFPNQIVLLNVISALLIFLSPVSSIFFYGGVVMLLVSAMMNGVVLNGQPNGLHFLIRVCLSVVLVYFYRKIH